MKDIICLSIESSCDETSCAIVKNGREVYSNVILSQIEIHKKFGGVVPEVASRNHVENIDNVVKEALNKANVTYDDIDFIACTYGPGLVGALLVGVSYAKALAFTLNKPLVAVNHIEGHIAANYITHKELEPPFVCLVISGGHTHLVEVDDYNKYKILGKTRDDAIGEAFDKTARILGLGYPGGPKIQEKAESGFAEYNLPKTHFDNLDFSFSGIKTAVLNLYNKTPNININNLCKSFEEAVTSVLVTNTMKAIEQTQLSKIVIAGGVSANTYIRETLQKEARNRNLEFYCPELILCTDNAAMIGSAAYYNYLAGKISSLRLNAIPNLKIGD